MTRRKIKLATTRLLIVFAALFSLRYFFWRAWATMNPTARWFFYLFLAVELLNFLEAVFFYVTTWKPTQYATPPPLSGRTVDILIPTYNEPIHLLRETLICAISVRYPHKTYLLDDGNRPEARALASELGCGYIARADRTHAKAGNLNHALEQTDGEFIVTLDADHVPMPDLIDDLVGFFAYPKVATVQTAQDFYNLDSFQHFTRWEQKHAWQQQELFFSVIQPGKDGYNAAYYCGSPAMLRRKALEEIGGFATESITEDMHTGLRLQKKGWRVIYHNRTLARGLAPQTYTGFATQWRRWGQGAMQVLRRERVLFDSRLSFAQRLCYFSSYYYYWMSYQKLIYVLTPVFCLLTGVFPLVADPAVFASYFLPYFIFNVVSSSLLQGGLASFAFSEQYNMVKIPLLMKSLEGLFERNGKFSVTPKSQAGAARWTDVGVQLALLVLLVLALVVGGWRLARAEPGYPFWATTVNLIWAFLYLCLFTPVVWRAMMRKELRASYRFPRQLDVPTTYSFSAGNGRRISARGFACNLSRDGFSITHASPILKGTVLDVELSLPRRTIRARARVMRHQEFPYGGQTRVANGLRFEQIDARDQDEISKYLFWEIAPRHGNLLRLTRNTQQSPETGAPRVRRRKIPGSVFLLLAALLSAAAPARAQRESPLALARTEAAAGRHAQATEDFRRVLQAEPDNTEALAGLADSLEATGRWRDAMPFLSRLVELQPKNSARLFQLARMKSWSESTRPEAMQLFSRAVQLDPANAEILVAYAEVLSWSRATRPQAISYFEQVLARNPGNRSAMTGKAQLLAWCGESGQAMALYDKVLAADPSNVAALRGKAEILNWKGRHEEAHELLARARQLAPADEATLVELARANYGLHRYQEAQLNLTQAGVRGPEVEELRRGVSQALGPFVELGYDLRRNRRRLDFDRLEARVSTRLGAANRLGLLYQPTLFRTRQLDFNSNYFSVLLDSQPRETLATHFDVGAEQYFGAPAQVDGGLNLRYRARPSFELEAGFERRSADDTLLSTRGALVNGLFLGQVRSNLATIGGSYSSREHHYDVSVAYTDGVYAGRNLDSNRRWSVEANIGKSLHGYQPYVRVAYGFTYLRFDHDADFEPGAAPTRVTGGYFSPTRYVLNSGQIYVAREWRRRVKWDAQATFGVQNAETTFSSFSDARFASTFTTHLVWVVNAENEFRFAYDFLDVFNAFHRHLFRVSWRHYF